MPEDLRARMDTGSAMGAIVAAMCLPDEYSPVRIRDAYSTTPTAVAKATEDFKLSWSTAVADTLLPQTDMVIFQFRNALRHTVRFNHNPSALVFAYAWRFDGSAGAPANFPTLGPLGVFELEPSFADSTGAYAPHGTRLPAGIDKGHKYLWVDATAAAATTLTVTLAVAPGADTGNVQLVRWVDGRRVVVQTTPFVGAQAAYPFTITQNGYYSIVINQLSGATNFTNTTVAHTGTSPCWEHRMLTGYNLNIAKVQSYAIIAGSVLWRNTASFENAQGDAGSVQVGNGVGWESVASAGSYSGIASTFPNNWKSRYGPKGIYGFLKPEDAEDLAMYSDVDLTSTGFSSMAFPLDDRAPFIVYAMSSTVAAGRETSVRLATHIQYQTNDTWADVRQPSVSKRDWEDALTAVTSVEQFHDNPVHIAEILATIGRYGAVAADIGAKLLDIFGYKEAAGITKQVAPVLNEFQRFGTLKRQKM